MTAFTFSYEDAFSRNIGWLTAAEQTRLRSKRVAIAGLGGVGGNHLLTLTRLGIGKFTLAEFDEFGVHNFNRQAGSDMSSVGRSKLAVLSDAARRINPELDIRQFPEGVDEQNIHSFLADADLYIDGLDFFAMPARELVFGALQERKIPGITVGPLGMSAAGINFLPGRMSFEQYFQLRGCSELEKLLRFLVGLSPALLQRSYVADPAGVDFVARRVPSTAMGVTLASGLAACDALKILLARGPVLCAPYAQQFDAYRNRHVRTWRPGGNRHPLQRLALAFARRKLGLPAA